MSSSRLRAPSIDGALLAIPPLQDSERVLGENWAALAQWDYDIQGRSAIWLREAARAEISKLATGFMGRFGLIGADLAPAPGALESSQEIPWVVTGHQPELFHPGVWVKNFAAAAIARKTGGVSINVIVDNDLAKATSIRVPSTISGGIRKTSVEFDRGTGREVPFEDLSVADEATFASFPGRVREILGDAVADPLIDEFWPLALARRDETPNLGLRFAAARHDIETRWGTVNLEVPLSDVCQTDVFYWFLSHILAHLPRFQDVHNSALRAYRAANGIRSRNHPVPALETRDDWLEAPFWIWRAENPRRQPLLARQSGRSLQLRIAGERETLLELPLSPDREACCAVEMLREMPARSIRLRTRALTTTLFCRFLLGDVFLHGIGGAKYDELGDSIAHQFFGIRPPTFLTLSQTLWLGLPLTDATQGSLDDARRSLRDVEFNPDRLLSEPIPEEARRLIEAKREAIAGPLETRRQRKRRWKTLRSINELLRGFLEDRGDRLQGALADVQKGLARNRIATNRDYSSVLHSRRKLRDTMTGLDSLVTPD